MAPLFDHLTAVFLGGAVLLLLGSVWLQNSTSAIQSTEAYQQRTRAEALRVTLDQDFAAIGRDVPPGETAIVALTDIGATWTFEFRGRISAPAGQPPDRIRYTATSQTCGAATCRRLRRFVWTGTAFAPAGLDLDVSSFRIVPAVSSPLDASTSLDLRVVLLPAGRSTAPPATIDRRYRLVNQELRSAP